MKRAAERQLTKDDEDADDSQDEGTKGFQMADPASLSERTIRGLPKRAFGVVPATPSPQPNAGANAQPSGIRFGGFGGFGNNAPSPFTFSANVPTSAAAQSSAGAKPPNGILSSASPGVKVDREEAAVRYCLNLRGLNVSLLETITKAVEADPTLDISVTLEQYTKFRSNIEKDFTNEINSTNPSFGFSGSVHTATAPEINSDSTKPTSSISKSSTAFDNKAASKTSPLFGSTTTTGSDTKPFTSLFGKLPQNPTESSGKLTGFGFEFRSTSSTPLTPGFSAFTTDLPSKPNRGVGSSSPYTNITGSIGNPVGFGFGSLPTTPSAIDSTKSPSSTPDDGPTVPGGTEDTGKDSPDAKPPSADANPYNVDGAGEEGETTIFETKAKAYKMTQKGDKAEWEGVGTGQLKLKVHETGRRRLLMRNSSNGKVILNFNLYTGFKTAHQTTKSFSFRVPGKGDSAAVYSIRVATSDDATKWQKTVEDEVDALAS